jgi:hypothetical protein
MTKTMFNDTYPIYSLDINKTQTIYKSVDEILEYLKGLVDDDKIAQYISTFDNYAHTTSINGEINLDIQNAKIIIFCFGQAIPSTKILAVRPRSIAVSEVGDKFVIDFLQAPKETMNDKMVNWVKSILNK